MKALYMSAASVALICAFSARAQDSGASSQSAAQPSSAAIDIVWADSARGSSLLTQAQAVLAALQARAPSASPAVQAITVVDMRERLGADVAAVESTCQRMPIPGSRIRETRCYTPSSGEAALNDYQFQEEMRQIRNQQAMRIMQQSQYERVVLENQQAPSGQR